MGWKNAASREDLDAGRLNCVLAGETPIFVKTKIIARHTSKVISVWLVWHNSCNPELGQIRKQRAACAYTSCWVGPLLHSLQILQWVPLEGYYFVF